MRRSLMLCLFLFAAGSLVGRSEPGPTIVGADDESAFTDPNLNPAMNENYEAVDDAVQE